ncbi:MAG: hypothetical protein Q4G31_00375 [bacterium]|nr:hypothetical protein [bacterium]
MNAIFLRHGDPCPCCGEPIDLSKTSTKKAVNGLSGEMAKQIRRRRLELLELGIDAMDIAAARCGIDADKTTALSKAYIDEYANLAALQDSLSDPAMYGLAVDAMLARFKLTRRPYMFRLHDLAEAVGMTSGDVGG